MRNIMLALLIAVPGSLFALNFDAPNTDQDNKITVHEDLNQMTAEQNALNLDEGATNDWWGRGWGGWGGWGRGWGYGGWGGFGGWGGWGYGYPYYGYGFGYPYYGGGWWY